MLVISYGMPKSGSTLLFELTKATLQACGHRQAPAAASLASGRKLNFTDDLSQACVAAYQEESANGFLVLKTHSAVNDYVEAEYRAGRLLVTIALRDPRDIALSMLDHGARSRALGKKPFAEFHSLDDVVPRVGTRCREALEWAALAPEHVYQYERFAFDQSGTVGRIASQLGLKPKVERVMLRMLGLKPRVDRALLRMKNRNTLLNKGVKHRHHTELTDQQMRTIATAAGTLFTRYYEGTAGESL